MKKLFLAIAAVATLLASCSKDDVVLDSPAASGEQVVTFEVSSPELDTRYGEGEEATTLEWFVYEGNTPTYVLGLYGTKTFNKSTTVQIKFIIGRTYHVLFWAHADGAPYKVDPSDATMVVDYAKLTANQESYDAFYKFHEVGTVTTSTQGGTVELKRPFAQLNIGTSDTGDAIKANLNVTKTGIKVKTFSTMNFKTGNVGGEVETTFNIDDMAEGTVTINNQEYDIISMNYLLVNEKQTPDVVLSLQEESGTETLTRTFTSIPVERNHRTYILGTIYTQPANFNVVIDAKFDDNHFEKWDGTTYDEIEKGADGFYSVSHAAEFAWILNNVKEDVKIRLEADINFGGNEIPVFADKNDGYNVILEGNGNRIFNFKNTHESTRATLDDQVMGLFNIVNGAEVSNLTIEGADVDAGEGGSAYAGALFGRTYGTIKLTNVTVKNSKVAGTNKVGGLIGLVAEDEIVIENCHVIATDITTHDVATESGLAGGLIGYIANHNATKQVISNSSVKGGVFNVINSEGDASRANSKFIGAVGGSAKVELINCSVDETGMTYNETANGYTSPYGELVGGNRDTATVVIDGVVYAVDADGDLTIDGVEATIITPENLASTNFDADGAYYLFVGNFNDKIEIKGAIGKTLAFDGSNATFAGHIKFTAGRIAGNANELATEKSGNYTFKGFKTQNSIAIGSWATTLNIEDCDAYMMYLNISNSVVNMEGNTIVRPVTAEDSYLRYDGATQKDIIQVYADNYTLNLYNNIIKDEKGMGNTIEVYGQYDWQTNATYTNLIKAEGNILSNTSETEALIKIYNDVTYAPVEWPADYRITDEAKTLAKELKTKNTLNGGSSVVTILCRAKDKSDANIALFGTDADNDK